ncbi:Serine/threonine-protein phosphatase 7 long form [Glycine max]|nr:Serine/threonine-protein phosphatase 7 long form [Glycine max]
MASSSSSSSSIQIKSGPIEGDVLWMQPKHVSEHVWNGEPNRKLHIRRAVPIYQGQEEIPEEIIPLLRQSGFYWIMKMDYLKINSSLITALIERWRLETHTFHMRCEECTITLQDVSVLLGLPVDGAPLIGQTNLDWGELCEELLGVRPQEGELQGSVVKLSWLAQHFLEINIHDGNVEHLQRFTRAWILRFIGAILFVDKSSSKVSLRYLQFLRDFEQCSTYAWGPAVLAYLYREMCSATNYKIKSIGGMCILIQMWAWERCTTLAPKRTPPVLENKPLGHRWLRRGNQHIGNDDLIVFCRKLDIMKRHESSVVRSEWHQPDRVLRQFGMQQPIPESPSQPQNIHGLTLKGKQDENWFQLLALMIGQWNNRADFRVDIYPRQEGLLSFNSDYMVWYRRKTKMFVDQNNAKTATLGEVAETLQYMVSPQGRNTWTVDDLVPYVEKITILSEEQERITEPVAHGLASERRFLPQQFHMLPSSVETRGFDRRREIVQAEDFSQQMEQRCHGMYYTPPTFSQYPSQMYQYPFEGHDTDMSASSHSYGGQHDAPMATPNAPLAPQWNVPGAIPDMGDLLGIDLHHEFSTEAEQQGRRQRARRNPDREARRWDRPCGTGSRHHGHHND